MRLAIAAFSIVLVGCTPASQRRAEQEAKAEVTFYEQGEGVLLMRDKRTTCEYFVRNQGGIVLRADPNGNVTPNCPAARR